MHKIFGQVSWKSCYCGQIGNSRTCTWSLVTVGIFPLNPWEISDLSPPKLFILKLSVRYHNLTGSPFIHEGKRIFLKVLWYPRPRVYCMVKIHHPDVDLSPAETSSLSSVKQGSANLSKVLLIYLCYQKSRYLQTDEKSQLVPNTKQCLKR